MITWAVVAVAAEIADNILEGTRVVDAQELGGDVVAVVLVKQAFVAG